MCGRYAGISRSGWQFLNVNPLQISTPERGKPGALIRHFSLATDIISRCPEVGPGAIFHEGPEKGAKADQRQG